MKSPHYISQSALIAGQMKVKKSSVISFSDHSLALAQQGGPLGFCLPHLHRCQSQLPRQGMVTGWCREDRNKRKLVQIIDSTKTTPKTWFIVKCSAKYKQRFYNPKKKKGCYLGGMLWWIKNRASQIFWPRPQPCGSSQATDRIRATEATQAAAVTTPDS